MQPRTGQPLGAPIVRQMSLPGNDFGFGGVAYGAAVPPPHQRPQQVQRQPASSLQPLPPEQQRQLLLHHQVLAHSGSLAARNLDCS